MCYDCCHSSSVVIELIVIIKIIIIIYSLNSACISGVLIDIRASKDIAGASKGKQGASKGNQRASKGQQRKLEPAWGRAGVARSKT